MENYQCPNTERNNPFAKLIRIQKFIASLQARIVASEDEIDKLARKTTKQDFEFRLSYWSSRGTSNRVLWNIMLLICGYASS